MASDFSVQQNIPVANHVYKYLVARCGDQPLIATRTTFIGSTILSLLSRNSDIRHASLKPHTKVFQVIIKEESYLRNGVFINYKSAKLFNDLIDKMFREELYCHIIINKFNNKDLFLKNLRHFLSVYNITEDDIKFETLYRDFKRKKDQITATLNLTPNNAGQVCQMA